MFSCDYMFNIRLLYYICRILSLVKKKLVSHPNFFKGRGRPLLVTIYEFFLLVSKMAHMSPDAHILWLIKRQAVVFFGAIWNMH